MKDQQILLALIGLLLIAYPATEALAAIPKVDFNNDGATDIAVGSPYATVDGIQYAGLVTVFLGNNKGTQVLKYDQLIVGPEPAQEQKYDYFGYAVAPGDFNGDGFTDLAIGVPRIHTFPLQRGVVIVAYGTDQGLKLRAKWCFNGVCPALDPQSFTMPTPKPDDRYGSALAVGDFKMDGIDDLAVGAPFWEGGSLPNAGGVHILHGGSNKLTPTSSPLSFWQANANFGYSLAAGNFGKTSATDLAIGIPFRDGNAVNDGAVAVYYGSLTGLSSTSTPDGGGGMFFTSQDDTVFASGSNSDYFGWALAAGDFGTGSNSANTGFEDLAVGIPGKDLGGMSDAGAVTVLYGSSSGLSTAGSQQWTLVPLQGTPVAFDGFGQALIAGNFGYDGHADLAVGVPYHPVVGLNAAGVVSMVFGSPEGLTSPTSKLLNMSGSSQSNALLGASLSAMNLGGDGYADIVIGIPRWNLSVALGDAGAVSIRYGTPTGPAVTASDQWLTDTAPQQGAQFGFSISH